MIENKNLSGSLYSSKLNKCRIISQSSSYQLSWFSLT